MRNGHHLPHSRILGYPEAVHRFMPAKSVADDRRTDPRAYQVESNGVEVTAAGFEVKAHAALSNGLDPFEE